MEFFLGYSVNVFINKIDENGKKESESFEYLFENENAELISLRNQAIEKASNLISFFGHEIDGDTKFSSFNEAEKKGFKGFNSFSVNLFFHHDEAEDMIYGSDDEVFDWLESEANYYKANNINVELMKVINNVDMEIEILKPNYDFFIIEA